MTWNPFPKWSIKSTVHDLYAWFDDAQWNWGKYSFLHHVADSKDKLTQVLNAKWDDEVSYLLMAAKKTFPENLKNNWKKDKSKEELIYLINEHYNYDFEKEYDLLIAKVGSTSSGVKLQLNEYGLDESQIQKLAVMGITKQHQFDNLRKDHEAQKLFLAICEKAGFSQSVRDHIALSFLQEKIKVLNRLEKECVDEIFSDTDFAKNIASKFSSDQEKKHFVPYRRSFQSNEIYKNLFFQRYYASFVNGKEINREKNKDEFQKSDDFQLFFDEIIKKDIERAIRYAKLDDESGGIKQNGWETEIIRDPSDPKKLIIQAPKDILIENVKTHHDKWSSANVYPKTVIIKQKNSKEHRIKLDSSWKATIDISAIKDAKNVETKIAVQPQLKFESEMYLWTNKPLVEYEAPLEEVLLEEKNKVKLKALNELLSSAVTEPVATVTPTASLVVWWPSASAPITTDNMIVSGTGEPWRNVEVSVWWVALPEVTVEPDGSWQIPVTWLTAWPVNIQTRMRDAAGTWWEAPVNRLYTCTFAPPTIERPTINKPWSFVYWWAPVNIEWVWEKWNLVVVRDWATVLGTVRCDSGTWERKLPVGNLTEWNHDLTVTGCDASWTEVVWLTTTLNIIVGYMRMEWLTWTRNDITFRMHWEPNKWYHARRKKESETNRNVTSGLLPAAWQETIAFGGLTLAHGKYEVECYQDDEKTAKKSVFTIDPHRVLPDTTRLPTSQDRNPVFHGTAEPNEVLTIKYKVPWTDDEKEIKVDTDGAWEWSFTLPDTITGVYDLKLSCAGENHTINYTSEWVSRRPVMDESMLTIKNSDENFTLSGFIDRRDLDCEAVAIFDGDTEIARVPLGKFSMKNRITRNRSTNSAFSVTLPANLVENDKSKVFTIKPVKNWADIDEKNTSTVTVTKVEDMYNAPREALKEVRANITEVTWTDTPNVIIKWTVGQPNNDHHKIKKVAVWRHTRWTGDVIKRDYQEVNVEADGSWTIKKTFTNNGKYTYSCAPIIDAEPFSTLFRKTKKVLWTSSSTTFEVDAERNKQRSKRYNPLSWKRPWGKKKSSSADEWDKNVEKKWGDGGSEGWGSGSKWWFFSGLKWLLNGDFLPEPSKSEWKSIVQRWKNIVNGDNDLVKVLEWKKSESK